MPRVTYIGPGSSKRNTEYYKCVKNGVRTRMKRPVDYIYDDRYERKASGGRDGGNGRKDADDRECRSGPDHGGSSAQQEGSRAEQKSESEHNAGEAGAAAVGVGAVGVGAGKYYADHHGGGKGADKKRRKHRHRRGNKRGRKNGREEYYMRNGFAALAGPAGYYPGNLGPYGIMGGGLQGLYAGGGLAARAATLFQPGALYGVGSRFVPGIGFLPDMNFQEAEVEGDGAEDQEDPENRDARFLQHAIDSGQFFHNPGALQGHDVGLRHPAGMGLAARVFGPRVGGYPGYIPPHGFDAFTGGVRQPHGRLGFALNEYWRNPF